MVIFYGGSNKIRIQLCPIRDDNDDRLFPMILPYWLDPWGILFGKMVIFNGYGWMDR